MNIIPSNYIETLSVLKDKILQARYKSILAVK